MKIFNIIEFFLTDYHITVAIEPNIYTNDLERISYMGFDSYLERHKRKSFSTFTIEVDGAEVEMTEQKSINYYLTNTSKDEIKSDLYEYIMIHHADFTKALDYTLNNIDKILKDYKLW